MIVVSPHCGLRRESVLGGEIYERRLLSLLPRRGFVLEIGLPAGHAVEREPGWRVTPLRPGRGLRWYLAPTAFVPYVFRLLREGEVDLLRGHSVRFTGPSLLVARALARRADVPIVLHHLHTEPRWTRLEAFILRRAEAVVTISHFSRRQLLAAGVPAGRIHVVYPGVDVPSESEEAWPEVWPAASLRLLFVGRLIGRKRADLAVRALDAARARGVDASLVIAGDGRLLSRVRRLVRRLGILDYVTFVGRVNERDKWRLLRGADVFLFPSALEGFGFAAAEAQAAGVPVVCTAGTSSAEIVRNDVSGFAVRSDAEEYARAIERLADTSLRERFGAEARVAAKRFSWERAAAEIADVYRHVASPATNASPSAPP